MDSKNFAIGILTVTAVVLFVGLVLVNQVPQAQAIGQTASGGDYIVATGQLKNSTEAVYVLDAAAGRLMAYVLDSNSGRLVRLDGLDMQELADQKAPDRGRDGRRRRR